MSKKRKESALFNSVDDTRSIVNDFCLRGTKDRYEAHRCIDYRQYHKLEESEMIPTLDAYLTKLFAGEIDSGNGNMLDSIIVGAAREALPDLRRQRWDHADTIRRFIIRRTADRDDITRIKEEREKERDAMQRDLDIIQQMISNCGEV